MACSFRLFIASLAFFLLDVAAFVLILFYSKDNLTKNLIWWTFASGLCVLAIVFRACCVFRVRKGKDVEFGEQQVITRNRLPSQTAYRSNTSQCTTCFNTKQQATYPTNQNTPGDVFQNNRSGCVSTRHNAPYLADNDPQVPSYNKARRVLTRNDTPVGSTQHKTSRLLTHHNTPIVTTQHKTSHLLTHHNTPIVTTRYRTSHLPHHNTPIVTTRDRTSHLTHHNTPIVPTQHKTSHLTHHNTPIVTTLERASQSTNHNTPAVVIGRHTSYNASNTQQQRTEISKTSQYGSLLTTPRTSTVCSSNSYPTTSSNWQSCRDKEYKQDQHEKTLFHIEDETTKTLSSMHRRDRPDVSQTTGIRKNSISIPTVKHPPRVIHRSKGPKILFKPTARPHNRQLLSKYSANGSKHCEHQNVAADKSENTKDCTIRLDLHGYFLKNAIRKVKKIIATCPKGTIVQIITGIGNHSKGGKPVIKPAVEKLLSSKGYKQKWTSNGGMVTFTL